MAKQASRGLENRIMKLAARLRFIETGDYASD